MKMRARSYIGVGLLAFGVTAWYGSPVSAEELGLDIWHVGELENQMKRGERHATDLERRDQITLERIRIRGVILANLLAGKTTPEEAGRGFLALNQSDATVLAHLRAAHPAGTDTDRAIRQMVVHLESHHLAGSRERALTLKCELAVTHPHITW